MKSKSNSVSLAKGLSASSASAAAVGAASSLLKSYFNKVKDDDNSGKDEITQIDEENNIVSKDIENKTTDDPYGKAAELALNITFVLFFYL